MEINLNNYYKQTSQSCDTSGSGWLGNSVRHALNNNMFKNCKTILDLGCGTGYWTKHLRKLGFEVTPCDISNEQFNETILSDMHGLIFKNETFDGILCTGIFEHSVAPFIALSEMSRVLKNGGVLYIDMPAIDNLDVINLPQHINTQHYNNMINMARKVGLILKDFKLIDCNEAKMHQQYIFKKEIKE